MAAAGVLCLLVTLVVPSAVRASASTPTPHVPGVSAYWLVASDGGVFSFGGAPFYGSTGNIHLNQPIVGMAGSANSGGYWLVASDGGIFSFGSAPFYGSTGNIHLNRPVVGMAAAPNGAGYWLVASDGGIFAFGNAPFYGSMGGQHLNRPIVGMAATPDGHGYWLVAADGGIFSFGDAHFYGSTGNIHLNQPIVGMTATQDGGGYWFTASDGGVFAFGDAKFYGSLGNVPQSRPIVAITGSSDSGGYWFSNNNGAVTAFGDSTYWGSAPQVLSRPIVGMAPAVGDGTFAGSSYQSGSYGYDISNFQCGNNPPQPHTIGIVQVEGRSFGPTNPCLQNQAQWAGGGLNLYIFLTFGQAPTSVDPSCAGSASPTACNYGFNAALDAFQKASLPGVNTAVPWWIDVEGYSIPGVPSWAAPSDNAALIQGALDGLHYEGLNSVGIYASPGVWNGIVGPNYGPAVPYWMAWYSGNGGPYNCANIGQWTATHTLPKPLVLTQYASTTFDEDYAC